MGWLISTNPEYGRKEQVADLLNQFRDGRKNYPALVDHSQKGNTLYALVHIPTWPVNGVKVWLEPMDLEELSFELKGNYRVILVFLLQGPRRGEGGGWGYKAMDEQMGPYVADCPDRLLKQSQVDDRHGWRQRCRDRRKELSAKLKYAEVLKPGDTVEYKRGPWVKNPSTGEYELETESVVFERNWSRTFFIGANERGRFRFRWENVKIPSDVKEAA